MMHVEESLPLQESGRDEEERFKHAIIQFLGEYFSNDEQQYSFVDVDISSPRPKDMERVRSGNFQIDNLRRTTPFDDPEKVNFHFYVGKTEFHITGKAAARVYELMEGGK